MLAVLDFEFMGGSMGTVVGEKVALAIEQAIDRKLPFISVAASGGARMQEGMLSLVQMAKTSAAATRLAQAGLPFISVLTDPTTGGVYASFASRGDVILAEPGALIGFAGPRVIEQLTGRAKPKDAQTAEYLLAHGQIDGVVDRARLRNVLATLLQLAREPLGPLAARRERAVPPGAEAAGLGLGGGRAGAPPGPPDEPRLHPPDAARGSSSCTATASAWTTRP